MDVADKSEQSPKGLFNSIWFSEKHYANGIREDTKMNKMSF